MKRIAIIGCGGSGKSTLARRIGARLNIPVHHLDHWYWKAGWTEMSKEQWAAVHDRLCNGRSWILDGNYGGTERLTSDYIRWIWEYRQSRRPRIMRTLEQLASDKTVVILDSYKAVDAFLVGLGGAPANPPLQLAAGSVGW